MEPASAAAPDAHAAPAGTRELVVVLLRSRATLALGACLGLGLALAYGLLAKPVFRAEATILIEQDTSSGLLGDLAMLASLASAPATASELSVLESRRLAEEVLAEGRSADGAWDPLDARSAGLATLVDDRALRPLALVRRALAGEGEGDVPLVLPERGLHARVVEARPGAPRKVELEFLAPDRLRVTTAGLRERLRLSAGDPEELAFAPRTPLDYRGLVLELEPWGDVVGACFALEHLPPHEALERLQDRLNVRETALNSGVIEVAFADSDPRRAARTVNALCGRYMESLAARGQRRASRTVEYVRGLLDEELASFERAQDDVMRLQEAHPDLIAPEDAAGSFLDQLARLQVERVQLELSRRVFGDIVAALDAGDARALARIDDTLDVGVLVDPVTSALLAELARLEAEASTFGADLLDAHPLVTRNREASAALVARTRDQLASRLAGIAARDTELAEVEEELRGRLTGMPEGMRLLSEAHVQLAMHGELVPYLVKSLQGAEITRSSAETRADLIDPAVPPAELSAPDFPRLLVLGLLAGLAVGTLAAFAREPAKGRVHDAGELASALGAERVIEIGRLAKGAPTFASERAGETAEALRVLRASLRFGPDGAPRRRIGVTDVGAPGGPGELRAAAAAELAFALAAEGRRTLLVDADLDHAALTKRMGVSKFDGLAQNLEDDLPWPLPGPPGPPGTPDVLPAGLSRGPTEDLLARGVLERLLESVAVRYDAAVVALPDAVHLAAFPALLRALDVVVVVHRARTLPRARVAAAARALRAAGARALAGVLVRKR